jgi:hypothetical protein
MTKRWIPPKANAARVRRARKAQALRAERRGKAMIEVDASLRADEGIEALNRELDQKTPPARRKS